MDNFQKFIQTMNTNIGYKSVILPLLPKGHVNILDVGGGSGILSHQMKLSNPQAHVTLLDHDPKMIAEAKANNTADAYVSLITDLSYHKYDAVVLCSVLHEVENWQSMIDVLLRYIKPNGKLIIRDGFKEENIWLFSPFSGLTLLEPKKDYMVKLKDPIEAVSFYMNCGADSIIGSLDIEFNFKGVYGTKDDVRSFLQTYTWGFESMDREKNENHLFASRYELYETITKNSCVNKNSFKYTPICQQNYFKHLSKIADIDEMWNTHFVLEVSMKEEW